MKLIVVVHAETTERVDRNVAIAQDAQADGVFLINHKIDSFVLGRIYYLMRKKYPDWWIGINYLDLEQTSAIMSLPHNASALWVDNAMIDENEADPTFAARIIYEQKRQRGDWNGLYFGGIAFKYQPRVKDLARVARLAMPFVDIITTSGDETGKPPTIEKIKIIREAVGNHPIAIASGISAENAHKFMGITDYALVSTAISSSHSELNPEKTRELSMIVHGEK